MKIKKILKFLTLESIILALIISCASCGSYMTKPKVTMYTKPYPCKAIDAQIDVFQGKMPNREYIEIAKISCSSSVDSWNMKQILKKAREIGADGIIIIRRVATAGGVVPVGNVPDKGNEAYGVVVVAIIYK